jgi:hypothetical protein
LNHLLFRWIPDELASDTEIKKGVKQRSIVFRLIREAGLEVDERFQEQKPKWYDSPGGSRGFDGVAHRDVPRDINIRLVGFQLRVEYDQQTNPLWAPVLAVFPRGEGEAPSSHLLRIVRYLADSNAPADESTLRAVFELCIHYCFIRSAAKLLERISPKKLDVMDFAHAIKRCMQNIPIGMRVEKVQQWQEILRSAWARLDSSETITATERLFLHEILMGRFLSIKESMSGEAARMLTEKYHGVVDIADLRAFYDDNPTIHWKGPGTINALHLAEFTEHFADCEFGLPVHITAYALSSEYSFVAVSDDGYAHCDQFFLRDLLAEARKLKKSYKIWFRIPNTGDYQQVPWSEGLINFAQMILKLAQKCDYNFHWIVLTLEPELASLPWQHLFLHLGRKLLNREIIISLTPNLGWAPLAYRETAEFTNTIPKLKLSEEDDEDIRDLKTHIDKHMAAIHDYPVDATIVLGHGKWVEDDNFPEVTVGDSTLNIDDWIEMANSRLVVLHSCHSGRTQSHFLGDYGALPGLILGLGSRILCAPVAEVPPTAAEAFNECLFQPNGQKEIGLRYLAAIKREPAVSLYNLYGMAGEPIFMDEKLLSGLNTSP